MIGTIVGQNRSLSDAAKTPKDTSPRKEEATRYSAQVSSSSNSKNVVTRSQTTVAKSTGKAIKASFEGLTHGSSTVLQFNGVGYDRKSNQTARYNKSFQSHESNRISAGSFTLNKNYGIMDNYSSMTVKDSSSDRLGNVVRNNMMFR